MSSERRQRPWLAPALALAVLGACADLERGDPAAAIPTVDAGGASDGGPAADGGSKLSFARDVHPLLVDGCARCHSSSGQASDTDLLITSDASRDLTVVARFINQDNPAGSRLLVKGAGMGHGGGAIFAAGSPEHTTMLQWITQGSAP